MPFQLVMKIPQMQAQHDEGVKRIIDKYAALILATMKGMMSAKKSGRIYRKKGGRIHQASAALQGPGVDYSKSRSGQAPAIDEGALIASLTNVATGEYERTISAGTTKPVLDYAWRLEFGTVKMAPRPYFLPAFEQHKRAFRQELRDLFAGVASSTSQPYGFNNQP